METIKLEYQDILVIDPGYIKNVVSSGEQRFNALKLVKVLHEGDDGWYNIYDKKVKMSYEVGVDSGRLWLLQAEFDCTLKIDAGLSSYVLRKHEDNYQPEDIVVLA